jgi:hypothetical protein
MSKIALTTTTAIEHPVTPAAIKALKALSPEGRRAILMCIEEIAKAERARAQAAPQEGR